MTLSKRSYIYIITIVLFSWANAQNRYMIHFTDKNDSPYSVDKPSEFLTESSIERKAKFGIEIDELDLPVNETEVQLLWASENLELHIGMDDWYGLELYTGNKGSYP